MTQQIIQARIPSTIYQLIGNVADTEQTSIASIVREALTQYLINREKG